MHLYFLDEDSDESNNEFYNSENDVNEYSDDSNSDVEYTTKKGCNKKKLKFEDKSNSKIARPKRTKKVDTYKDDELSDTSRVATVQTTNYTTPHILEIKGILFSIKYKYYLF